MKKSVLMVLILCAIVLTWGCGSQPTFEEPKQQEQIKEENAAVETTLGAGEWYVGEDIPPGRYVITPPDDQSGNIAIYDEEDAPADLREILNPFETNGVKSITYKLKDGQIIEITSMDAVLFKPTED